MSVEDNRAHCLSQMVFLKKFLIPDHRGLSVHKRCLLTLFDFPPKRLKESSHFLHDAEDNRVHLLSQMGFLKKILSSDYRGLSVRFFEVFGLFFKTTLRIFPIFCMIVEDNRMHFLS